MVVKVLKEQEQFMLGKKAKLLEGFWIFVLCCLIMDESVEIHLNIASTVAYFCLARSHHSGIKKKEPLDYCSVKHLSFKLKRRGYCKSLMYFCMDSRRCGMGVVGWYVGTLGTGICGTEHPNDSIGFVQSQTAQ